ncbi:aminodeoxychorismate synthase component I [Shimazuella kribbensis]|uniref:aminodeoxychorismate synthase component I n=1 Tax=Shimazuella kribbensis TaxID=139808 RepID=UPI0003FCB691|nr:aminodeoxychorismate synthase component I [Shimazuella kribbensis]
MIDINFLGTSISKRLPEHILVAKTIDQVKPILEEVESYWQRGYYAVGYVSYEASPAFDPNLIIHSNPRLPLIWFAVFQTPDTEKVRSSFAYQVGNWQADCTEGEYEKAIGAIHAAIGRGDTYQVNHTIRMHADFEGDTWSYYQHLSRLQPGYNAYLDLGVHQLLSLSPELFFRWEKDKLITRPMKGTAKRGRSEQEDIFRAAQLLDSTKDRAENLMIVDLLRNDLGKIAVPGSVHVPSLFAIEKYPTVWQMTSTIEAITPPESSLSDIFTALFPCGSITGAPKRKTMELIRSLEQSPREAYCGTIGYLKPGGEAVFNVAIRTVVVDQEQKKATYGVGGGITWDSTSGGEYEEVITKAKILESKPFSHQLLESIRLENGTYTLLEEHIARMRESASYFGFPFSEQAIRQQLKDLAKQYPGDIYKVRLLLSSLGRLEVMVESLKEIVQPVNVTLATDFVSSDDIFLYHKTTERQIYEERRVDGFFDTLLWNERGELTEFTIGNVVVEIDGKLVTPPQESGLLAGTMRKELLEKGEIEERIIYKMELSNATSIWLINSVRGWVKVELK